MTRLRFVDALEHQPRILQHAHRHIADQLCRGATSWLPDLRSRELVFAGVGASAAALATPVHVLRYRGRRAERLVGDEQPNPSWGRGVGTIAVSQSGRSPETLSALKRADGPRVAIVNASGSPLADTAETALTLGDVPDSPVSTCAFTATQLALGHLADAITGNSEATLWPLVPAHVSRILDVAADPVAEFVKRTDDAGAFDVVATAESLTAAEQGALLLREAPRVPATAMPTRTYLHGPVDVAGPTAHILFGATREAVLADELASKKVPVLYVTDGDCAPDDAVLLQLPLLPPLIRVVLEVVVAQIVARDLALHRGVDPEQRAFKRLDTKVEARAFGDR